MALIHVCPLSQVSAVLRMSGAGHVISLLALAHRLPPLCDVPDSQRLHLAFSDIIKETADHVLPEVTHVVQLLAFLRAWDRRAPLLIHCYAGVSRSTAAAYIALCTLVPEQSEAEHAAALRLAAPTATPNARLVALADAALRREGRMSASMADIGRGSECFEGVCSTLHVPDSIEAGARPVEMV